MTSPSRDPDFEAWLDEQERLSAGLVRCPVCGHEMPIRLTDMSKGLHEGRYSWTCPEETCGRHFYSDHGQLLEVPEKRIPSVEEIERDAT
jgi:hypothetical protein